MQQNKKTRLNSPNEERIELFEKRILERYSHEKLKDCPIDRIKGFELEIEKEYLEFKDIFPRSDSAMQGELLSFANDIPEAERYPLTVDEHLHLSNIKRTALLEVYRAEGIRKDKLREHRLNVINSLSDLISATGDWVGSRIPLVGGSGQKELSNGPKTGKREK